MTETKGFFETVYGAEAGADTRALYRDWAAGYDAELLGNGYASPRRCAEALAAVAEDLDAPVLDLGCGTGLSGAALREAGFTTVDGSDFSVEMLAAAEAKGVYRQTFQGDLSDPVGVEPGAYAHVTAVGAVGPGHGPPGLLLEVMRALPPGGCFVFTLNDLAMDDWAYEGAVREIVDGGWAQLLAKDYGDHLPGRELGATVYVLRRC